MSSDPVDLPMSSVLFILGGILILIVGAAALIYSLL